MNDDKSRKTSRKKDRHTAKHAATGAEQTGWQTGRQADKAGRETGWQADSQTGRQTDRQTDSGGGRDHFIQNLRSMRGSSSKLAPPSYQQKWKTKLISILYRLTACLLSLYGVVDSIFDASLLQK